MSFELSVVDSSNNEIYEDSFSSGNMMKLWSEVAEKINLPLIKLFYDKIFYEGLVLENSELIQLNGELIKLEEYFNHQGYSRELSNTAEQISERSVFDIIEKLKNAIEIALNQGGSLIIT